MFNISIRINFTFLIDLYLISSYIFQLQKHGLLIVILVLLDLSAAFDTIDLHFLRDMYGIRDQTLAWVRSYWSDRLQRVNIKGTLSDKQNLNFGVPHGSNLGSILYRLYVIHRFGLLHHSYADDTQLYISIKKQDYVPDKLSDIEQCVSDRTFRLVVRIR